MLLTSQKKKRINPTFKMVFSVIGFGLTSTALLVTFAKYFTSYWFGYFMVGLVLFEISMFTLTKGKTVEIERPLTRTEKKSSSNIPASPPESPKPAASAKASNQSPKSQASNKQEKAAEKTAKKAQAKEAKAEAKAAAAAK